MADLKVGSQVTVDINAYARRARCKPQETDIYAHIFPRGQRGATVFTVSEVFNENVKIKKGNRVWHMKAHELRPFVEPEPTE